MQLVEGIATVEDVDEFVAELGSIGDEHDCAVQAFDARYVADRAHLERAVEFANRARERGEAIATDHAVEILLYAAGRRQIDQALEMGVDAGECPAVVVVHGRTETADEAAAAALVRNLLEPHETLESDNQETLCAFFDIGTAEIQATDASLGDLVRERVALLAVEK